MKRSHFVGGGLSAVALIVVGWIWVSAVQQQPGHIFTDMLSNNLSTPGVTRVVSQTSAGASITQYSQLSLGSRPMAHAITVFKQNDNKLVTEQIGNPTGDYVRYRSIQAKRSDGKPLDASSVVGTWAKLSAGDSLNGSVTSGLFKQSLLGVLPVANLRPEDRSRLLQSIAVQRVFRYDAKKVKAVVLQGRKTYQYDVSIAPAAYIRTMQQFGKLVGQTDFAGLNPANYNRVTPIVVRVNIDAKSHQLAETYQTATKRTEQYRSFGIVDASSMPNSPLTTNQLVRRLAALNR